MNKYSELSDFEANKLVAERKKINFIEWKGMKQIIFDDDGVGVNLDYCNNWCDAGPLMVENYISLESVSVPSSEDDGCYFNTGEYRASGGTGEQEDFANGPYYEVISDNPCRAIAECYLMMTEESPE